MINRDLAQFCIKNSPVPVIWKTHSKGKIYLFKNHWPKVLEFINNTTRSDATEQLDVNQKTIQLWKNNQIVPKLYTEEEFSFTPSNLYWLGLHFSDGHIRNNGSALSFTWQVGSSNPFQGYWFPQFIQSYLGIFSHKRERSLTYLTYSKCSRSWFFKTNVSSLSPVFAKLLEAKTIISQRQDSAISGYSKNLPKQFVSYIRYPEVLFQGIMDGDGSYNISKEHGMYISLSLDPTVGYDFIEKLPLVPITVKDKAEKYNLYALLAGLPLVEIRFAPGSLSSLPQRYTEVDIVNQLEFMLKAAKNSTRPDKVYKLIAIVKRICSKDYGEYRHCLEIQRKIRDEARKRNLLGLTVDLERRYPRTDEFYKPFVPSWMQHMLSKSEISQCWDFFLSGAFLEKRAYPKLELLDFSKGVPIDFDMTMSARI